MNGNNLNILVVNNKTDLAQFIDLVDLFLDQCFFRAKSHHKIFLMVVYYVYIKFLQHTEKNEKLFHDLQISVLFDSIIEV